MTRPAWPPFDRDSSRVRTLDPAIFGLETDRWAVLEWTQTAGGGRWRVETVLGLERSEAGKLSPGEPVEVSTPLPWLGLTSPDGRFQWVVLQCTVWQCELPELRWRWKAGAITLTVPEHATGEAVKRVVPGLTLLRRVIRHGAPKQDARRRARAAAVRARVAAGDTVEGAAFDLEIARSTAYQDLREFPEDGPSS